MADVSDKVVFTCPDCAEAAILRSTKDKGFFIKCGSCPCSTGYHKVKRIVVLVWNERARH